MIFLLIFNIFFVFFQLFLFFGEGVYPLLFFMVFVNFLSFFQIYSYFQKIRIFWGLHYKIVCIKAATARRAIVGLMLLKTGDFFGGMCTAFATKAIFYNMRISISLMTQTITTKIEKNKKKLFIWKNVQIWPKTMKIRGG